MCFMMRNYQWITCTDVSLHPITMFANVNEEERNKMYVSSKKTNLKGEREITENNYNLLD